MRRIFMLIGILLCASLLSSGCFPTHPDDQKKDYSAFNPSGDFTLTDQNENPFHLKDHRGEVIILFFGYTACPDVCPVTLSKLSRVYSLLGDKAKKVLTVFVTVDPERDTPAKLKEYLEYFNVKAVGLTGTQAETDKIVGDYKASYEKADINSAMGYSFNHSDYLYLIDTKGKVRHLFRPEDTPPKIVGIIDQMIH